MDIVGGVIVRCSRVSPRLSVELNWRRRIRKGLPELALCRRWSQPGSYVIDVGGHSGLFTLAMANAVGRHGGVTVFEPNPESRAYLERVCRRMPNIVVRPEAVSDRSGHAVLSVPERDGRPKPALGTLRPLKGAATAARVAVTTLDSWKFPAPVNLIKIDVEGYELEVISGASALLATSRPRLIVEIEDRHLAGRERSVQQVVDAISSHGYEPLLITPDGLLPYHLFDVGRDQRSLVGEFGRYGEAPRGYINNFAFVPVGTVPVP